jgi:hypothetical protein
MFIIVTQVVIYQGGYEISPPPVHCDHRMVERPAPCWAKEMTLASHEARVIFILGSVEEKMKTLKIGNVYGNFDLTRGSCPKGYQVVSGDRLTLLCRKLNLRFVQAVTGWTGKKRYGYKPVFGAVIVSAKAAPKLLAAIQEREAKRQDPKTIAANERAKARRLEVKRQAEQAHMERCRKIRVMPSSRTSDLLRAGVVDEDTAELMAFKGKYRHEYTDYDEQFNSEDFAHLRELLTAAQRSKLLAV